MNKVQLKKLLTDAGKEYVYEQVIGELAHNDMRYSFNCFNVALVDLCRTQRYESEPDTLDVIEILLNVKK